MPEIRLTGVTKHFAGTRALEDVALHLRPGEVHALMGENGAGKSTLIRILAGVTAPDRMSLEIGDSAAVIETPASANALGFRFVHQELNVVPALSVAENVLLGRRLPGRLGGVIDWPTVYRTATDALARLRVTHIDPRQKAARLGTGDQMLMRIAAMFAADDTPPRLYVMDEPTAALTQAEADRLFAVIRDLKASGAAILYVSHRIGEVMALADRVSVLRDGKNAGTWPIGQIDKDGLIQAMTGRPVRDAYPARTTSIGTEVVCRASDLATARLSAINFELRAGEILGIAGLENAGQTELLRTLVGDVAMTSGTLEIGGGAPPQHPAEAWDAGIAYIPRERRREALMLGRDITANTVLPHLTALRKGPLPRRKVEADRAQALGETVGLRYARLSQAVRTLSGGNQQKVVFARAIGGAPKLLLLDEPTRGVDVGARSDLYALIRRMSADGTAVLVTSGDLPELIGLSDRILILRDGRQIGIHPADGLDPAKLLSAIYGKAEADAA